MLSQLIGKVELTVWPLISTPVFTAIFLYIVWRAFRKISDKQIKKYSELPLNDGEADRV